MPPINCSGNRHTIVHSFTGVKGSLPPASEGWGKVLFSVCLSVNTSTGGRGVPQSGLDGGGGVPRSGLDGWGILTRS